MIFSVDFGSSQTNVGYQFLDSSGNLIGSRITSGISVGAKPGMYFAANVTPPAGAVAIQWDCDDAGLIARDDFQELLRLESLIAGPPALVFGGGDTFYQLAKRALQECFAVLGDTFTWRGKSYGCVLDQQLHRLTTLRDLFITNGIATFPARSDSISVNGKRVQVVKLENAAMKAVAGGTMEDQPFTDDLSDPALDITFDKFIKK